MKWFWLICASILSVVQLRAELNEERSLILAEIRANAERGDAIAQAKLGAAYWAGNGVVKNPEVAAQWFHKAADQGDAFAQSSLGYMHAEGEGVPRDSSATIRGIRSVDS